jgi:hypothetical protein
VSDDATAMIGLELVQDPHSVVSPYPTKQTPVPLIVHNGFMDLCFLMTHFVSHPLPNEYQECKQMIHTVFPYIYDTKIIATECPCWDDNDQHSVNSALSTLFHMVARNPNYYSGHRDNPERNDDDTSRTLLDDIYVVPAFCTPKMSSSAKNKNSSRSVTVTVDDQEHEAAYDAFMTGAIFVGLCQRIQMRIPPNSIGISRQPHINNSAIGEMLGDDDVNIKKYMELRSFYGLNKLYQMSIFTMDLDETRYNRDPMSRGLVAKYTYRVSNIDSAITTRDIVESLSNLRDAQNRPVNYLIIWIDDITFLVAASFSHPIIQSVVATLPQQPVVVNDEPEEGEEVEEMTEPAVNNDEIADATNDSSSEDLDTILREHADILLHALSERFRNSETTIAVLEDYLEAQRSAPDDNTSANENGSVHEQNRSWMNRMWSMMGWPFTSNTSTSTNKKHNLDEKLESGSTSKRRRIH